MTRAKVIKAGDGGALPARVVARLNDPVAAVEFGGGHECRAANARVVMTPLCPRSERVETQDPVDRAHGQRDGKGQLVRGDHVAGARPRQYHSSYIVEREGRRYTIETAADWLHAARQRLAGIPGIGYGERDEAASTRAILERGRGGFQVRGQP